MDKNKENKETQKESEMINNETVDKEKLLEEVESKLKSLPVKELVSIMASDLASVGFRKLGLTDEQKNLEEAKLAIDSLEALFGVIEPKLNDQEQGVLKSAISNLKMTYVKEKQ